MKRILAIAFFSISSIAFAATTVPVQLINPTGSTAGQAIISTGPSSAPAWGGVPVGGLAAIAANTVIGNATGSSAIPTAITVTGCNGAAQALQWTNGTGFGCNSNVATSGANTNITSLSSPTITTPNIVGTSTNNNAAAGSVGEYVTATGTAVSLTTGTAANITSISLTAGDWDVWGSVLWQPAGGTTMTAWNAQISQTSATFSPSVPTPNAVSQGFTTSAGGFQSAAVPSQRLSLASTTTVYLVANAAFSGSTETASGIISARRRR